MEKDQQIEKKSTGKKVFDIITSVICVIIVVVAIFVSIQGIQSRKNNGVATFFGKCTFSIQSESMSGTFEKGDLIICEKYSNQTLTAGEAGVKDGTVISFYDYLDDGTKFINSHRIDAIGEVNGVKYYTTRGDNNAGIDKRQRTEADILAVWTGNKINGAGKVVDFINGRTGFFVCIVLPVLIYTLYQIYKLIIFITDARKEEILEEAKEGTSDEIKDKIIQEYLAKQKAQAEKEALSQENIVESTPKNDESNEDKK